MKPRVVLLSISLLTIQTLALQLRHDEVFSTSSPVIDGDPSQTLGFVTTTTTTTTSAPTTATQKQPFNLPVTSEPPDMLGIGDISDFYGPGTWSAWFLLILASWSRVLRGSDDKFDPNTLIFLFTTNWAAVALSGTVHAIKKIPKDSVTYSEDSNKLRGMLGAAFNVTFWGVLHAALQLYVTCSRSDNFRIKARTHRVRTLALGLFLPSLALIRSMHHASNDLVPALYWQGMESSHHVFVMVLATPSGIHIFPLIVALIFYLEIMPFLRVISRKLKRVTAGGAIPWATLRYWMQILQQLIFIVDLLLLGVSTIMFAITRSQIWALVQFVAGIPFMSLHLIFLAPIFAFSCLLCAAAYYAFRAYVTHGVKAFESCFFMPCAPQSIKEEIQSFALFAGILLFLGWEVFPVLTRWFKERYQNRRGFFQDVENRMWQLELRILMRSVYSGNEAFRRNRSQRED